MTTFTTAPEPVAGDPITSTQWNTLAGAFNDRIKSGLADCAPRIHYAALGVARQLLTEIGNATERRWDHWLSYWMHLDPATVSWRYNDVDYEGFETNPLVAAILGIEGTLDSEDVRLSALTPAASTATPAQIWSAGKAQRGVVNYARTERDDPFCQTAIDWQDALTATAGSPQLHNQTWGGYLPAGQDITCGGGSATRYHFKSLRAGVADRTYSTCATESDYATSITQQADRYLIVQDGNTLSLSHKDWVLIPQGQPSLSLAVGRQMYSVASEFIASFSGTAAQRASETTSVAARCPDWQKFFTQQLYLAPSAGEEIGGILTAVYPTLSTDVGSGYTNEGDYLVTEAEVASIAAHEGFAFFGLSITATDLAGEVTAKLQRADHSLVRELRINNGTQVLYWPTGESVLEVLLVSSVSSGSITIEFAELETRLPEIDDALALIRLTTTLGELGNLDGHGSQWDTAARLLRPYFRHGCIVADESLQERTTVAHLQGHPLHETARRLLRDRLRVIARQDMEGTEQLIAYDSSAKTLRFRRFAVVEGETVDLFDGIGPSITPVTAVVTGREYAVHGTTGTVTYDGTEYAVGEHFTAGTPTTFSVDGDAELREREGIRTALGVHPSGCSNEWVLHLGNAFASTNESFPQLEVSKYYPHTIASDCAHAFGTRDWRSYLDPLYRVGDATSGDPIVTAEAPSGFKYIEEANASANAAWASSHQVYSKPYVITSAVMDGDDEIVLTLDRELRSIGGSPEPRCDANVVTDYLAFVDSATAIPVRVGDCAYGASLPSSTHGAALPRFFLTRLVPTVYEDSNDTPEVTDTRMFPDDLRWCWFVVDAICGGFVDRGRWLDTTEGAPTPCEGIPHYTFQSLLYQAGGEDHRTQFPILLAESVRPDKSWSAGPLSNTIPYAAEFSRLARAVNLLNYVPLYGPIPFESRTVVTREREDNEALVVDFQFNGSTYDPMHPCTGTIFNLQPSQGTLYSGEEGYWFGEESYVSRAWSDIPGDQIADPVEGTWATGIGYWTTRLEWAGIAADGDCTLYDDPENVATAVYNWQRTKGELRFSETATWLNALPTHVQELLPSCQFAVSVDVRRVLYDDEGNESDTTLSQCWKFDWAEAVDGVLTLQSDTLTVACYWEQDTYHDPETAINHLPYLSVDVTGITPGIVLIIGLV